MGEHKVTPGENEPAEARRPAAAAGFTLMEILVAMTLTSLLMLVLAWAFRGGVDAWRRLGEDPAGWEILSSLPAAFERDLEFLAATRPLGTGVGARPLPLCGAPNAVAFWTRYAPEGSAVQGVHLAAYIHDPVNDEVLLWRVKPPFDADVRVETRQILQLLQTPVEPLGRVPHVSLFELSYEARPQNPAENEEGVWTPEWPCEGTEEYPRRVRLRLEVTQGRRTLGRTWTFVLGLQSLKAQGL